MELLKEWVVDYMKELQKPFPAEDVEWRVSSAGEKDNKIWVRVLAYITNRAIQERLDNVFGIDKWKNEYREAPRGGVLCGISVYFNGEWITKWDGADNTSYEPVKGGLSSSMKRAAVQWGIGRYLYNLEASYAEVRKNGRNLSKVKINDQEKWVKWNPPSLPKWALPTKRDYQIQELRNEYINCNDTNRRKEIIKEVNKIKETEKEKTKGV